MTEQKSASKPPGWRDPMLWLVLGIPLATLLAGVWTLRIAAGDSATDAAPDRVRRTAQVQVSDLGADQQAAALGLSAQLQIAPDHTQIVLLGWDHREALWLEMIHPAEADRDLRLPLQAQGDGHWRGTPLPDGQVAWHLRLAPADGQWRLVGRLRAGQTDTALQPAIGRQ